MVEIVDQEEAVQALMATYGEQLPDTLLININYLPSPSARRIACLGLSVALSRLKEGRPIILYSFLGKNVLMNDPRFVTLMGQKNVAFIRQLFALEQLNSVYKELITSSKTTDLLAQDMLELVELERAIAQLRHDLGSAQRDPFTMSKWLRAARNLGFQDNKEEITSAVQTWQRQIAGFFEGKFFEGLFVDVDGTLIKPDGSLNEEVKRQAEELAGSRPITAWTDGDLQIITPQLRKLGIDWKIISKFEMAGAEVEEAIDDLSFEEFTKLYRIRVHYYHKTSTKNHLKAQEIRSPSSFLGLFY